MLTPAEIAYSGMGNGRTDYDAFCAKTEAFSYAGMHCHDFYEIYIHYQGGSKMLVDNESYTLVPDMLMIFPPFSMHGLTDALNLSDYDRGYLYISTETMDRLGYGYVDLASHINAALRSGKNQFQMVHSDAERCRRLLKDINERMYDTGETAEFDKISKIVSFLSIILKTIGNVDSIVKPVPGSDLMQEILSYINNHYTEPLQLQQIADRFNISVSMLSHGFTSYTNRSVYDYILYRRITLAQMMLHTNRSLSEICSFCGFSDYSSFLRKFTSVFGVSPKAYRKELK